MASHSQVLPGHRLTLKDRLSRLTFVEACKLLGPRGKELIQRNAATWDFKIAEHVRLGADLCRVRIPGEYDRGRPAAWRAPDPADGIIRRSVPCRSNCSRI